MLQVSKQETGDQVVIKLSGTIEENVDLGVVIGPVDKSKLDVYLKDVQRINSVGVKSWIKYFQALASKNIQLRFFECSTAIVEQINLISNFTCGGSVESIYVPFCCNSCSSELLGLFNMKDLKKVATKIPEQKCAKCGGAAVFDDIIEEYFGFLERG